MALTLGQTQEAIIEYVDSKFVQPIVEQGIPDTSTVRRNSVTKAIEPYLAYQLLPIRQGNVRSFAGPRGDDYDLIIQFQCIAPTAKVARQLSNKLIDEMLGETFPYAGSVRMRLDGGMVPVIASNAATEAYMVPTSFGIVLELHNV
jgi:hypothetical protein